MVDVKKALADTNSIFYTYQELITLRHENEIVVNGDFKLVHDTGDEVLAYYRILGTEKWLVVANLSGEEQQFTSTDRIKENLLSNYAVRNDLHDITLKPYEAFAVAIK